MTTALRLLRFLPALAWMAMIFIFSSQPGGDSGAFSRMVLEWLASVGLDLRALFGDGAFWVIRKLAHFTEYLILFLLLEFALAPHVRWPRRGWVVLALVFLYAASDEFHQLFVPRRVGDLLDVLIDTLGGLTALGLLAGIRWLNRRPRRRTPPTPS